LNHFIHVLPHDWNLIKYQLFFPLIQLLQSRIWNVNINWNFNAADSILSANINQQIHGTKIPKYGRVFSSYYTDTKATNPNEYPYSNG